jgi:hypothetical protein
MRVVYDVSMLGLAQMHPVARAGIYRVVHRVARGLVASGECELSFSVTGSVQLFLWAREHLRSDPGLARVPLLAPSFGMGLLSLLDRPAAPAARARGASVIRPAPRVERRASYAASVRAPRASS